MINLEITRNPNENTASALRRFTKKVQGAGILPRVRGIRFAERELPHYKKKMKALKMLKRKADIQQLIKLGKMVEKTRFSK